MIDLPKMPSVDLAGRCAVVTGASSGIGQGAAVALAQAGAHVVCLARGAERLDQSVSAMQERGWRVEGAAVDVTDLEAIGELVAEHTPDIIVNSAGLARHTPALETQSDDYDAVMEVNLKSAYFLSTHAAREMQNQGKPGSIIHISSQMGHVGGIDRAVYCASKHALEGMIKSMAIEWGPSHIRINSICPTFVRTPLTEPTFANPERVAWILDKIKLGRVADVSDIMGAVLFLASDWSAMVTGTSLLIDGGWTAE